MTQDLFDRDGAPFTSQPVADKGHPGFWRAAACFRCGGSGHFGGYGVCFRCRGGGKEHAKFHRLYTREQLAKLNTSKEKRDAKKEERRVAEMAARDIERTERLTDTMSEHGDLLTRAEAVKDHNRFIASVLETITQKTGELSEKQRTALLEAVIRTERSLSEGAASTFYGAPKQRIRVPVEVVRTATFERTSFRGGGLETVHVTTMKDAAGHIFVAKTPQFNASVGEKFTLNAAIKSHDEYRGTKQTTVQRVQKEETK